MPFDDCRRYFVLKAFPKYRVTGEATEGVDETPLLRLYSVPLWVVVPCRLNSYKIFVDIF
ncbi:MAG: hypothetical protein DRH43_07475 [Deltaproteobacteria bacterium]|nr:MAG: hypothetical protein DRH50_10515 [Deltaproteobacteria bacterium]RLC09888.1 MAG: hypothetical protein DRH43_07475 [Deltaproteobacteria bacterium]